MKQFATYEEENIRYWTNRASGYSGVNQEELASNQKAVWRSVLSRRIAARFPGRKPSQIRVLDVGTGSGILAIAALKLGAREADGVDIDPMCVRTAGENAERNGVDGRFRVLVGDLSDKAEGVYDIITANIVAAAILSLAPAVPALMAPGAKFICSGIIDERKDEVLAGLQASGLRPVEIKEKRGWVCILCEKA